MHIIDSHFHWWPRSVSERFCKRRSYPRAEVNDLGGYSILQAESKEAAAEALKNHPHFMMPGASIEVLEFMAIPGM